MTKKNDNCKCEKCDAPCCRDVAIPFTRPKNKTEVENLKWYLHFDAVRIFIKSHRWYYTIKGKCIYLSNKNLCKIYDQRPKICRDHQAESCEITGKWYDEMFSYPEELAEFLNKKAKKR